MALLEPLEVKMKKSLLLFVTFFSLVSLAAQGKNYTVDMYALSNYSREYYAVEKLDFQTPDGNEFCVMALQKNGGTDKYRRSKIPVLILKKKDGNRANVITARMESIEMEPNTVGEGLQSIKPYESGFFIQQSFGDSHSIVLSRLYFDYAGKDRFRLVRYAEAYIDRYAEEKDFTEIDFKIDDNIYFEDINSDRVYNMHCEGTEIVPAFASPKYSFSWERRNEAFPSGYMVSRRYATVARNGRSWELRLPVADWEAKNFDDPEFAETDEGFYIAFDWGGGRYLWHELFFFKEIDGEPCLYEIESMLTTDDNPTCEYETEEQTRPIQPPIKISELTTEKILKLLGRGDLDE